MKIITRYGLAAALLLGIGLQAYGAETAVQPNTPQTVGSSAIPGEQGAANVFIGLGPGLAVRGGNTGWAVNLGGVTETSENSNLFVGADLGLNFWNYNVVTNIPGAADSVGSTGIQLLPTAIYRVQIAGPLFPYIGLSVGPHILVESRTNAGVTTSATSVLFEGLVRPGFFLELGRTISLQVDGKFGVLGGQFAFLPSANAVFAM